MATPENDTESYGVHASGKISADGTVADCQGCIMVQPIPGFGFYALALDEPIPFDQANFVIEVKHPTDPNHPLGYFLADWDDGSFGDAVRLIVVYDGLGGASTDVVVGDVSMILYRSSF